MKQPVDQIDFYQDWSQERHRMRRTAGPRGSPLGRKTISSTMASDQISASTVFNGNGNSGALNLIRDEDADSHSSRATKAIRSSLAITKEAFEVMIKEHRDKVADLETQLTQERDAKERLAQEVLEKDAELAMNVRELQATYEKSYGLHQRVQRQQRKVLVQQNTIEEQDQKLQGSEAYAAKLKKELDEPINILVFLQDGRTRYSIWYNHDFVFGAAQEQYACITNQNASRLAARVYGREALIDTHEPVPVELLWPGDKGGCAVITVEVSDPPSAKRRRIA